MIEPSLLSELAEEIKLTLESPLPIAVFVVSLDRRILAANSYARKHIGSRWQVDLGFDSILEAGVKVPPFEPHMRDTRVLRISSEVCETLVSNVTFQFGFDKGLIVMVPSSAGRDGAFDKMTELNNELTNLMRELKQRNVELEKARGEIRTLSGLLPICAMCKKINIGDDSWEPVEQYVKKRTDADFTHGYCPDCYRKQLEDIGVDPDE